ncbi:MAG TPA: PilN family type IVB pilus formation outer membrane protein [Noviherbaspirillum sp.]
MRTKLAAGLPALLMLSACTGLSERIDGNVDQAGKSVSSLVQDTGNTAPGVVAKPQAVVARESGIWLGKNVVKLSPTALPSVFYQDATFDRTVTSLAELAERLTLRSGIPTKVSPDALAFLEPSDRQNRGQGNAAPSPSRRAPPVQRQPNPEDAQAQNQQPAPEPIRIAYANGNFKGLLDTAAARFGVSWKYDNGTIHFYHVDSRTFQINSLPGASTFSATVSSGATSTGGATGGSGGGGSSNGVNANNSQNTNVASRMSVYESIELSVQAMLSPYGKVVASPATGTMTIVDTPDALERVAAYIGKQNEALSRQVVINVTVLSVNLNDTDEYGIDWNLVYNDLRRTYNLATNLPVPQVNNSFSIGVIGSSRLAGSTAVINALSKQGKVRRQTTASVVTLNNQPVPVQVAKQTSYLASMETSVVAQVGTTTTLTAGTVTSGFNMSILPHVLTNGTVLLQFSTDISTLRDIREVESGLSRIEVPELDTRNFLQRVSMKSGETLIISGFEQTDENLDRNGTGKANNYLLGGGYKAGSAKESIVILITPTTLGS